MIHKVGFEIDVREGIELSLTQFIDDLRTVLPKEWWNAEYVESDDPYAWTLVAMFALNHDDTLKQTDANLRPCVDWKATAKDRQIGLSDSMKRNVRLQAELAQEKNLTTHLDEQIKDLELNKSGMAGTIQGQKRRIENLTEKNDNQVEIIENLKAGARAAGEHAVNLKVQYDESLKDWVVMRNERNDAIELNADLVVERDGLMDTVKNDTLIVETLRGEVRTLQNINEVALNTASRYESDLRTCQATNREKLAESSVNEEMVQKIIDALEGAGYDASGSWGSDDELTEIETGVDSVMHHAQEVQAITDRIRTER